MSHALIIDDNMIVSRAIKDRLVELGFKSFDHIWTEPQAIAAAAIRSPDLIVIGDSIENGSALDAACCIAIQRDTPVLMVTADPVRARKRLDQRASFDGPLLLNEIESAVELACARN
jgi:two-component system, response regulator PdtaR